MGRYRISTPAEGWSGSVGNVAFLNGEAEVDGAQRAAEIAYCRGAGYLVEPIGEDAKKADDAAAKDTEDAAEAEEADRAEAAAAVEAEPAKTAEPEKKPTRTRRAAPQDGDTK